MKATNLQQNIFRSCQAVSMRTFYFPLCGPTADSLKSSITPYLSGDLKIDKDHYLTKPASREDLRQSVRNIFLRMDNGETLSMDVPYESDGGVKKGHAKVAESDKDDAYVLIGPLWHRVIRVFPSQGIKVDVLNFIPVSGQNVELMHIQITNISSREFTITPTVALPIFARALSNKHDHEHVTALLHRTRQLPEGVMVQPTMKFNEEGHQLNDAVYYVFGYGYNEITRQSEPVAGTFPTIDSFCGEGGTLARPEAVFINKPSVMLSPADLQGKEAIGALRFEDVLLVPGAKKDYVIMMGIDQTTCNAANTFNDFDTLPKVQQSYEDNQSYWQKQTIAVQYETGDAQYNDWLHWVNIQPELRRIFGCSFLPDHDYGKGGRGWRDIWQDLLSLILLKPESIRSVLSHNFAGVRIDGSNATIIGNAPGEFLADRNAISRVWMDHGVWPLTTLLLYIHQTGDFDILLEDQPYFRDAQFSRSYKKDGDWGAEYGHQLKDQSGSVYRGSILEHVLVQHLVQFFNVGEHNIIRLENADWNDGLDMGFDRAESVAFTSYYGGNLVALADLIEKLGAANQIVAVSIATELLILLDTISGKEVDYDNVPAKKACLFDRYFAAVQPVVSGTKVNVTIEELARDLRGKGQWIAMQIRRQEKVSVNKDAQNHFWYNGYYDNKGVRVEGMRRGNKDEQDIISIRMMLTSQVFPIMHQVAGDDEVRAIVKAVKAFLKDRTLGGYRLNTDFEVAHYLDLGRAFGFAYGTKENGAFFNHMIVMYANALYRRGFIREGYDVLQSIYRMSTDYHRSKIYPGIPEYFDSTGRGMYHFLTGSASWLVLTELTQVFGVRGEYGDLVLAPKLMNAEFNEEGLARVRCQFASRDFCVCYHNPDRLEVEDYVIKTVRVNEKVVDAKSLDKSSVVIAREVIEENPSLVVIDVNLEKG